MKKKKLKKKKRQPAEPKSWKHLRKKILTRKQKRSKAAKKGWRTRKKKQKEKAKEPFVKVLWLMHFSYRKAKGAQGPQVTSGDILIPAPEYASKNDLINMVIKSKLGEGKFVKHFIASKKCHIEVSIGEETKANHIRVRKSNKTYISDELK